MSRACLSNFSAPSLSGLLFSTVKASLRLGGVACPPSFSPGTATLTAKDQPGKYSSCSRDPHECEHLRTYLTPDVQLLDRRDGVLHDNKKSGCEHRGDSGEKGGDKGQDDTC